MKDYGQFMVDLAEQQQLEDAPGGSICGEERMAGLITQARGISREVAGGNPLLGFPEFETNRCLSLRWGGTADEMSPGSRERVRACQRDGFYRELGVGLEWRGQIMTVSQI